MIKLMHNSLKITPSTPPLVVFGTFSKFPNKMLNTSWYTYSKNVILFIERNAESRFPFRFVKIQNILYKSYSKSSLLLSMMMTNRWRLTKTFVFLTLCAISAPVRSETLDHLQTWVYLSCCRTTFSLHNLWNLLKIWNRNPDGRGQNVWFYRNIASLTTI